MKHFFSEKQSLHKLVALTAAAVFSLAAVGVNPQMYVSAEDADPATTEAPQDEATKEVELKLGEEYFYRWQRVTDSNIDDLFADGKEHRVLIIGWNKDKNSCDNVMLSGTGPDSFRLGHEANSVDTFKGSQRWSESEGKSNVDKYGNSDDNEEGFFYLTKYYVPDTEIEVSKDHFFTTQDYECPWVRMDGIDNKNKHINNKQCRKYSIRVPSSTEYANRKYYLTAVNDDGYMSISLDKEDVVWTFQSSERNDEFEIFREEGGGDDDECLYYQSRNKVVFCVNDDHGGDHFRMYVGEEYHFRKQEIDQYFYKKEITRVTSGEYIAEGNKKMHAEGTIIPPGVTLHLGEGSILSVEGALINNGTIENNGGVILVKKGGSIAPFLPGDGNVEKQGRGAIRMNGGDMIIQEGGAVYAGLGDEAGNTTHFDLDAGSTIINQGLLVFGSLKMGQGGRLEMYPTSKTFSGWFINKHWIGSRTGADMASQYNAGNRPDALNVIAAHNSWTKNQSAFMPQSDEASRDAGNDTGAAKNDYNNYRMWYICHDEYTNRMTDLLHRENSIWLTNDNGTVIEKSSQLYPIRGHTNNAYYQGPIRVNNGTGLDGAQKCIEYVKKMASSQSPDYSQIIVRDVSWYLHDLDRLPFGIYLDKAADEGTMANSPPVIKMGGGAYFMDEFIVCSSCTWAELTI